MAALDDDLDRDAIKSAMAEAGLLGPKVLMVRLRDGRHVFDLWAGPPDQRRSRRVAAEAGAPTRAAAEDVAAAIGALQHPE